MRSVRDGWGLRTCRRGRRPAPAPETFDRALGPVGATATSRFRAGGPTPVLSGGRDQDANQSGRDAALLAVRAACDRPRRRDGQRDSRAIRSPMRPNRGRALTLGDNSPHAILDRSPIWAGMSADFVPVSPVIDAQCTKIVHIVELIPGLIQLCATFKALKRGMLHKWRAIPAMTSGRICYEGSPPFGLTCSSKWREDR